MNPADPVTNARFAIATPRFTCTGLYWQHGRGKIKPLKLAVFILAANTQNHMDKGRQLPPFPLIFDDVRGGNRNWVFGPR